MGKNITISIIIPVYNAKNYLDRCVQSVLMQTLDNLEIILVDDGSQDGSGDICDAFAQQDHRVHVIHQCNAGVSTARNTGLSQAKGRYIGFVDADDWVEPEMFHAMVSAAETHQASLVMCDAVTDYEDGCSESDTITQCPQSCSISKQQLGPELLIEMAGSACRCLYRSDLLRYNKILFNPTLKFSEDRLFNIQAMGLANCLYYMKIPYYHRIVQSESAVHRFHADYYDAVKHAHTEIQNSLKEYWPPNEKYQEIYCTQLIDGAVAAINNYYYKTSTLTPAEKKAAVKIICADQELNDAIHVTGYGGQRAKWIVESKIELLIICARLANFKHRR